MDRDEPWVTQDIRASLNQEMDTFRRGDEEEMKDVQLERRGAVTEGVAGYRRMLERNPSWTNTRSDRPEKKTRERRRPPPPLPLS